MPIPCVKPAGVSLPDPTLREGAFLMAKLRALPVRRTIWEDVLRDCAGRGVIVPSGKVVYFIEAIGLGLVKIGKAAKLENRWIQLRNGTPHPLRLLKALPGYSGEERWVHALFNAYRVKGEWFEHPPIRDRLESLTTLGSRQWVQPWAQKRVVIVGSCGHEKEVAQGCAKRLALKPCISCAQQERFAHMTPDERRAEISAARVGYLAWLEDQRGNVSPQVIARLEKVACIRCGKPVYDNQSVSQSAISGGTVRRYCADCVYIIRSETMSRLGSSGRGRRKDDWWSPWLTQAVPK